MLTKEKLLAIMTCASGKFQDAMKARIAKDYDGIVTDDTCDSRGYSPFMLGGVGRGRKWIGGRVYTKLRSMGVRFDCERFEKTIEVPVTELSDNPAVDGAKIAAKLVESVDLTDQFEVYNILKSNVEGFDAEPLFGRHEYVELDAETGKPVLVDGAPVVLGSYTNDLAPAEAADAVPAWYLCSKNSILRVTREGEDFTIGVKGGAPSESEHTFDNDTVVWGWRARKIYKPGLPFYTLRSTQPLTADSYQAAKDLMKTFCNDAGVPVVNAPTCICVKSGTQAAYAARKIFKTERLENGASNFYFTEKIEVIEVDQHLL